MGMRMPPGQQPPQNSPSPQGDPAGGPPQSSPSGGISKLVAGIYSQMTQLMDALSSAAQGGQGVVSPDDIQELAQIIKAYQSFVTQTLGGQPGAGKPKPPVQPGQVSPMQGGQGANARPAGP